MTATQVFEKAQEEGLDVSLSTIYRNLHRLKAHGNVSTVSGDRGLRYEAAEEGPDHDHLICLGCGLTIEFVDDLIRGFGKSVAQRKGFEHKSSRFDILGFCGQCRAKDDGYLMRQSVETLMSAIENLEESVANLRHAVELIELRKQNKALTIVNVSLSGLKNALEQTEKAQSNMAKIGSDGLRTSE